MKIDKLRKRFVDTAVADCLRAVDGGAITGALILALCILDYLAALRDKYPGAGNAKNYKAFVDDFLAKVDGRYRGADLYWLRCAMVHTYALAVVSKQVIFDP